MATGRIGTNTVLTTRWSKAPTGGTTSLSGLDDASVSLVYSVGYEQVYRNGVLLSRGNDYTATNGTTITLIDATITGDIIEVFANATIPLTDTYSQTVANGKFINNTLTTTTGDIIYASAANTPARLGIGSAGQVLKVSGGVPAWGADGGKVLQVVNAQITASTTISTTTLTDTGITATITPTLATSKILILITGVSRFVRTTDAQGFQTRLLRGATTLQDSTENNYIGLTGVTTISNFFTPYVTSYYDTPNTTSATTYKLQAAPTFTTSSGSLTFQQNSTNPSNITLLEIGA